jgi:hypothetical protein
MSLDAIDVDDDILRVLSTCHLGGNINSHIFNGFTDLNDGSRTHLDETVCYLKINAVKEALEIGSGFRGGRALYPRAESSPQSLQKMKSQSLSSCSCSCS